MKTANKFMRTIPIHVPGDHQFSLPVHQAAGRPQDEVLPIQDSLQIKAAEYWLKLGDADQALRELEALPSRIWSSGWALTRAQVTRHFTGLVWWKEPFWLGL